MRPATAEDTFRPFGAEEGEFDNPEPGEVVYVSGHEVRTRRWTWRQSEVGKMTEKTSGVLYSQSFWPTILQDRDTAAL